MVQQNRKEQNVARLFFLFFFFLHPTSRSKIALPGEFITLCRYRYIIVRFLWKYYANLVFMLCGSGRRDHIWNWMHLFRPSLSEVS